MFKMQIQLALSPEMGFVFCRYSGLIKMDALIAHQRQVQLLPGYEPGFRWLIDFSSASASQIRAVDLQHLVDLMSHGRAGLAKLGPLALLAQQDVVYGLCRMWFFMAESLFESIEVFRSEPKALEWLGLDPAFDLQTLF
jgi:hypothetical protein